MSGEVDQDMQTMVQDHEQRILRLEQNYSEVYGKLSGVEASQAKIENMIYTQNTAQRQAIDTHQEEQKELLNTLIDHTLGLKQTNNKEKWKIIGAVVGGGGAFYAIIEFVKFLITS